jgi:hypothetical protein
MSPEAELVRLELAVAAIVVFPETDAKAIPSSTTSPLLLNFTRCPLVSVPLAVASSVPVGLLSGSPGKPGLARIVAVEPPVVLFDTIWPRTHAPKGAVAAVEQSPPIELDANTGWPSTPV